MIARLRCLIMLAVLCVTASCACACKLPVFRYALERWPADRYKMVAIVDHSTPDAASEAISQIRQLGESNANVDVETIDLSELSETQLWQLESWDGREETPLLQVFFPDKDGQQKLCWSGELTANSVGQWRDSPMRRHIYQDLTSGVSAVWILVEGRDSEENDRMAEQLKTAIERAESEISIPEGVILREAAAGYLQEHPEASMDDVLRSDIPLRIDFSFKRLKVEDDEPALRAMIAGWSRQGDQVDDRAFVLPVFGRGRMIEPLPADRFGEDAVVGACRYMVGECNCTVKALNPGVDLLMDAHWTRFMDETLVVVDPSLPQTPQPLEIPAGSPSTSLWQVDGAVVEITPALAVDGRSGRWLLPAIATGVILSLAGVFALMRRRESAAKS